MKTWTLRFRAADEGNFLDIVHGRKTVETRAATPKYRAIVKGDTLAIVCGTKRIEKKVKRVEIFPTIGAMAKKIPFRRIMPNVHSIAGMRDVYYGYPGYREKLKTHGVITFHI